ncbi:MAG: hemin-degrading factor [Rhodobiaceae bacterium]|nr:hemin-degrading factor [Rhodobiaceae bacterium]MCC0056152.1 hemin-degrading factor [Rhodobiaceae bacterium]
MTNRERLTQDRPSPETIRQARADNPKMRERDLAHLLGISEAEFVAAWCGHGARRINVEFDRIFPALKDVGEVMALTRNESAVHEKIGVFDNFIGGKHAAMMLGETIDTRMFPGRWAYGFAVEKDDGDTVRRSLQFFDEAGDAVHKVHTRAGSDLNAWNRLIETVLSDQQSAAIAVSDAVLDPRGARDDQVPTKELRDRWERMTDTHQFVGILNRLEISRHAAVANVGEDFAWRLDGGAVEAMMKLAVAEALPIMCFVGNRGCIQIHSGPIANIRLMGPWLNVMDEDFHLHLRTDHIAEAWAVRKPTDKGHVTSLEAYDAQGELVIQFFGKRVEGQDEREGWRFIVENLPRHLATDAA